MVNKDLNIRPWVYMFKQHKVSSKTVEKFKPLSLLIRKYHDVYNEHPINKGVFERTPLWMIYVKSASGNGIYWFEERREFHYVRFRVKEIVECLRIDPDCILFEDLTEENKYTAEDFREVVNKIKE